MAPEAATSSGRLPDLPAPPTMNEQTVAPTQVPESPAPDLVELLKDAEKWAMGCGLKPPFTFTGPEELRFPGNGKGYCVTVQEQAGKKRLGTARYTAAGTQSMWTIDGTYAG